MFLMSVTTWCMCHCWVKRGQIRNSDIVRPLGLGRGRAGMWTSGANPEATIFRTSVNHPQMKGMENLDLQTFIPFNVTTVSMLWIQWLTSDGISSVIYFSPHAILSTLLGQLRFAQESLAFIEGLFKSPSQWGWQWSKQGCPWCLEERQWVETM